MIAFSLGLAAWYVNGIVPENVTIILKDDIKITGRLVTDNGVLPLRIDDFEIETKNRIYALLLKDITYVSRPKK